MPSPKLRLQIGDRLTVSGVRRRGSVRLAEDLGDRLSLSTPCPSQYICGVGTGCADRYLTHPCLGLPIKLGLAGGRIIVGI